MENVVQDTQETTISHVYVPINSQNFPGEAYLLPHPPLSFVPRYA